MDSYLLDPENVLVVEIENNKPFILKMLEKDNNPETNPKLSQKGNNDD
ncbi:hypothetical protein NJHLHPIG_00111 [Klebsiella phage vB_KqM-Bilbo]|nr:hypothetical protein NJHLHPIG_00111 [Klebsiella phage vB_KqM-Bilbo]CAD5240716.1 hypothetical protein KBDEFBCI_00108 [Klebsiella phage vB_KqM-LilBean]